MKRNQHYRAKIRTGIFTTSGKKENFLEAPKRHREMHSSTDEQTWCRYLVHSTKFGISKIQTNQWS